MNAESSMEPPKDDAVAWRAWRKAHDLPVCMEPWCLTPPLDKTFKRCWPHWDQHKRKGARR